MNVLSVLLPDNSYAAAIEFDDDHVFTFDREESLEYVRHAVEVAQRAEYDAAVLRQLMSLEGFRLELTAAGQIINDLRAERPPLIEPALPIHFAPGVAADVELRTHSGHVAARAFCTVHFGGQPRGQLDPAALLQHAMHVLEVPVVADLDVGYAGVLTARVGVTHGQAQAVVDDLAKWRSHA